jgi:GNAT superfamily N-acetyltransferase
MSSVDLARLMDVVVSPGGPGDLGFVIETWGRSLRAAYPDMRTRDFVSVLRDGIDRRLNTGAWLDIAHPADNRDLTLGWALWSNEDREALEFAYVRAEHRRGGIGRLLGIHGPLLVTAMTADMRAIKRAKPDTIRYLPII